MSSSDPQHPLSTPPAIKNSSDGGGTRGIVIALALTALIMLLLTVGCNFLFMTR